MIPCLAASRHQGKVQLPLNTLQKKTIVVAGFSSSQFYFDFHIKKKISSRHRKKKSPCQQKYCSFLEESSATESGMQPRGYLIPEPTQAELHHPNPSLPWAGSERGWQRNAAEARAGQGEVPRGIPALSNTSGFDELGFSRDLPGIPAVPSGGEDSWNTNRRTTRRAQTFSDSGASFCKPCKLPAGRKI